MSSCRSYKSRKWNELYRYYEPAMLLYLANNYGWLQEDERKSVVNDTFIVLANKLPTYNYPVNQQGLFRRFLIAVLRNTALCFGRRRRRKKQVPIEYSNDDGWLERLSEENAWLREEASNKERMVRQDIIDLAIQGLIEDPSFRPQTREVFRRIVVESESPQSVADAMGLKRSAVDCMKARMMRKFKRCANEMLKELE